MKKILITGARAPAALEWIRRLAPLGYKVFGTDSVRFPLTRGSRFLTHYAQLPSASLTPRAFIDGIKQLVTDHDIDLIIPTCEEVFYLSHAKEELSALCSLFCDDFSKLRTAHNKYEFTKSALDCGVSVPETHLIQNAQDMEPFLDQLDFFVFKPVYSRFASYVLIRPSLSKLTPLLETVTTDYPWVAQRFIDGKEYCTYSIAVKGSLQVHTCYHPRYRAGQGSGIYFQPHHQKTIEAFVDSFVKKMDWHGQIAFDFMETATGEVFVLECNPRATSGFHCLSDDLDCARLFSGGYCAPLRTSLTPKMVGLGMLTYGLKDLRRDEKTFKNDFSIATDVIWSEQDKVPSVYKYLSFAEIIAKSIKERTSIIKAATSDGEWNGGTIG